MMTCVKVVWIKWSKTSLVLAYLCCTTHILKTKSTKWPNSIILDVLYWHSGYTSRSDQGIERASKGNWQLHVNAIHCMIHWCFAYDRQNYAQMTSRPKYHPFSYQQGGLSVQRSEHNPFGKVLIDQANEEDIQTPGGTEGFSLKPATLTKHYVNAEYRSTCVRQLRSIIDQQSSRLSHHLQPTRIKNT